MLFDKVFFSRKVTVMTDSKHYPKQTSQHMPDKLTNLTELADLLLKKSADRVSEFDKVNIIVMGKTGVGKSTLINNLFREKLAQTGIGKPVTQHLRKITQKGMPLTLYDTKGLELDSQVQSDVTQEIFDYIDQQKDTDEAIHLVYYAIHGQSNRIEETEIDLINRLAKDLPVIIVLTQAIGKDAKAFESAIDNMNLPIAGLQRVMAAPFVIDKQVTIDRFGLDELVDQSLQVMPEDYHNAFNNVQQANINRKIKAARNWTIGYVATTFGVGFTPIPFADAQALVPLQVTMLAHITAIFGINLDRASIISLIAAVGGTGSATFIGRTIVSNALKVIPGVGTIVGGLISGATAATVTTTLAYTYIEVLAVMTKTEANGMKLSAEDLKKLMKDRFSTRMKRKSDKVDLEALEIKEEEPEGETRLSRRQQKKGSFTNRIQDFLDRRKNKKKNK